MQNLFMDKFAIWKIRNLKKRNLLKWILYYVFKMQKNSYDFKIVVGFDRDR